MSNPWSMTKDGKHLIGPRRLREAAESAAMHAGWTEPERKSLQAPYQVAGEVASEVAGPPARPDTSGRRESYALLVTKEQR